MKIDMRKIIENKSEKEFYLETHKRILKYIKENSPVTFWEIIRDLQGSDRRVLRLLNEMLITGEIRLLSKKIYLKGSNRNFKVSKFACKNCNGKTVSEKNAYKILNLMKKLYKIKPIPTFLFDQRPVTAETTIKRALYAAYRRDLQDKRIAIVGDDDLTSLAIGLLNVSENITVFDSDKRLLKFIESASKKYKLPVKTVRIDLTKVLPEKYFGKYDVFMTDPTPNPVAFDLFVSVGLKLLKKGSGRVGYTSFFPSHQPISTKFQNILVKKNVIITDMIPKFTEYDFLVQTYSPSDIEILKKFDSKDTKLSFHENLTRFETTSKTISEFKKINLKNFYGNATKRVLRNLRSDPAYSTDQRFVKNIARRLIRT